MSDIFNSITAILANNNDNGRDVEDNPNQALSLSNTSSNEKPSSLSTATIKDRTIDTRQSSSNRKNNDNSFSINRGNQNQRFSNIRENRDTNNRDRRNESFRDTNCHRNNENSSHSRGSLTSGNQHLKIGEQQQHRRDQKNKLLCRDNGSRKFKEKQSSNFNKSTSFDRPSCSYSNNPPSGISCKPHNRFSENQSSRDFGTSGRHHANSNFNNKTNENQSKKEPGCRLGYTRLQNLLSQLPFQIAIELANSYNKFENLLKADTLLKERSDWVALICQLLAKVCECEFSENKTIVLVNVSESNFLDNCQDYLIKFDKIRSKEKSLGSFLQNLFVLVETLVNTLHNISKERFHEVIRKTIGAIYVLKLNTEVNIEVKDIEEKFINLEKRLTEMETVSKTMVDKNKHLDGGQPPDDFRNIELYPTENEILFDSKPFLRRSIKEGSYNNVEHYLDVQFRLLRQDLISPLREGIKELIGNLSSAEKHRKRINNFRQFLKCSFQKCVTYRGNVSYVVCFDLDGRFDKIKWEYNRWFMYGSLLFFTFDKFNTFFMGTVAEKKIKDCEKNRVIYVNLIGDRKLDIEDFNQEVIMVESTIFFQPYYHVLKALKSFKENNFPMVRYIVNVNPVIRPPAYLQKNKHFRIDRFPQLDITNDYAWPSPDQLKLDNYQYDAFKSALTREFVVMQGPPGTGKTFLGLKIVETLLKNEEILEDLGSPILLVCYTNHALDQFLEGILKFTTSIVRVGSQSKSEIIKPFEIVEKRKDSRRSRGLNSAYIALKDDMREKLREMESFENNLKYLDETLGIVAVEFLHEFMSKTHRNQLKTSEDLILWLLNLTEPNFVLNAQDDSDIDEDDGDKVEDVADDNYNDLEDLEDESRKQMKGENIIFDLIQSKKEDVNVYIFSITVKSLRKQINMAMHECDSIEKQIWFYKPKEYAKMRTKLEAKLYSLEEAIEIIKNQSNPGSKVFQPQYCINSTEELEQMNIKKRWKLYRNWVNGYRSSLTNLIQIREVDYRKKTEQYEEARQMEDINVLMDHKVIGTTTTMAAKNHLMFSTLKPKIVIVEEAAEVLEAHIVTALTHHCEHIILIGDHQQLRPNPSVFELARKFNLEVSLFERMVKNNLTYSTLGVQHRMRPEICDLITPAIYPKLENHLSVFDYESVKGISKNLFFLTHQEYEQTDEHQSFRNSFEGDFVLKLARYLLFQGYTSDEITILTTYSGQVIYLKMEKKKMAELKEIRISTVDNYQGEECKIIILSLVRSNPEHKIGFLASKNRVCVALSRAKHGFYMIGNFEGLERNSTIWPEIKTQLVSQEAIGAELVLECLIHDHKTHVSSVEDFKKVPEGGCLVMCNSILNCEHICKRLCHPNDRSHEFYKCGEACTKKCPEGHPCQNRCYELCSNCRVKMVRVLDCGHTIQLDCFVDVSSYPCKNMVETIVEACGHKTLVPCHIFKSGDVIRCTKPCEDRLSCGHACTLTCHVEDDPDHIEFSCMKDCNLKNKGCSANHMCQRKCFEKCSLCNKRVTKELPCGHSELVLCHLNPDYIECYKPCKKELPCGHKCKLRCVNLCGVCDVVVEKRIPECGHLVKMKCSIEPDISRCTNVCTKILNCGHPCGKKCNEKCDQSNCMVLVDCPFVISMCGHPTKVPCKNQCLDTKQLQKIALENCNEPCGEKLLCEHICGGTCSDCRQGRLHVICKEKCGRVKICGHSCKSDCSSLCPECKEECLAKCVHSRCPLPCGKECAPCKERCPWVCTHKHCTKKCSEPCNRSRCYEKCPTILKCGHECIGFCGEPCIDKCRFCHKEEVTEIFFGNEDEEDANFVMLQDCGHYFESSALEYYMGIGDGNVEAKEISLKSCPQCKTPIVSTLRFMNQIRKVLEDIALVKKKQEGMKRTIVQLKRDVADRLKEIEKFGHEDQEKKKFINTSKYYQQTIKMISNNVNDYYFEYKFGKKRKRINFITLARLHLYSFIVECLEKLKERILKVIKLDKFQYCILLAELDEILAYMKNIPNEKITDQQRIDISLEIDRFFALVNLLEIKSRYRQFKDFDNEKILLNKYENCFGEIKCFNKFDKDRCEMVHNLLNDLEETAKKGKPKGLTVEEKELIRQAMSKFEGITNQEGHWFKCSKGHPYYVGNCGQFSGTGTCPDCKERVGSGSTRIAAPEMLN